MARDRDREAGRGRAPEDAAAAEVWAPEVWVSEPVAKPGPARSAPQAQRAPAPPRRQSPKIAGEVAAELTDAVGVPRAAKFQRRLAEAARAYERDRYQDARRLLAPLAEQAPGAAAVRELLGLTLYRMGKWRDAIGHLEAFHALTGSLDQHPVLADCYRALKRWARVEELWDDVRRSSPSAEVVAEARIVASGSLADRGNLRGAIALLEQGRFEAKRPRLHHLRMRYALADLYERAGDLPRARELFRSVLAADREFADAAERLAGLD